MWFFPSSITWNRAFYNCICVGMTFIIFNNCTKVHIFLLSIFVFFLSCIFLFNLNVAILSCSFIVSDASSRPQTKLRLCSRFSSSCYEIVWRFLSNEIKFICLKFMLRDNRTRHLATGAYCRLRSRETTIHAIGFCGLFRHHFVWHTSGYKKDFSFTRSR